VAVFILHTGSLFLLYALSSSVVVSQALAPAAGAAQVRTTDTQSLPS
jgi:hypothetical protein